MLYVYMTWYYLMQSNQKQHRYMIQYISDVTGKLTCIYFGAVGFKNCCEKIIEEFDVETSNFWTKHIIYSGRTIGESVDYLKREFDIEVYITI